MAYELDLTWVAILLAINLQTSFLTPPFGFSLFYLKGVTPPEVTTAHLYRGAIPFVALQLLVLLLRLQSARRRRRALNRPLLKNLL